MSLSRRQFTHLASLSLLAGAVLPAAFAQEQAEDETFSPEHLAIFKGISRQTFEPYIGERFAIGFEGQSLGKLTLIEVKDLSSGPMKLSMQRAPGSAADTRVLTGFSLRFQGSGALLPQETYTFSQPALGSFPVLLVPATPGTNPPTYTAIFTMFTTPGRS